MGITYRINTESSLQFIRNVIHSLEDYRFASRRVASGNGIGLSAVR